MEKIMENEGIELYKNKNKYFLRYDAGELMIKMKNLQISEKEAKEVMNHPESSYDIIINYQDRGIYGEDF